MMDCKKALTEANGDSKRRSTFAQARSEVAAKRADRDATEGAVIAMTNADQTRGVVISLNCETDFVAKTKATWPWLRKWLKWLLQLPCDERRLVALSFDGSLTIADKLTEQTGVIGEKSRFLL